MSAQTIDVDTAARKKPAGGFRLVSVVEVASAWWAYSEGLIRIADLRAWFACHEAKARRCNGKDREAPRFVLEEIRGLTGVPVSKLRGSIKRLEAAGLLSWSESALTFGTGHDLGAGFAAFLSGLPNNARMVPVPRRIVRLIAGGSRPALIACILGHLLRCLYYRKGLVEPKGRCKASWVADTFGVSLRRVKDARAELVRLGWLLPEEAPQWALNRWGAWVSINLAWHRLDGTSEAGSVPKTAPPRAESVPKTAPPDSDNEPLRESKNQKPASDGATGFSNSEGQGGENPPTLRDVVPADLRDTGRLLTLQAEAVGLGLVDDSESGRLKFVAAAEHARVIGTRNPSGLFVRLVRRKLWHFLTQDDEDAARLRLKRHLFGEPRREELSAAPLPAAAVSSVSPDARMVQAVKNAANRAGFRGDAFYLLRRERPDWTRERWEAASFELSGEPKSARVSEPTHAAASLAGLIGSLGR
jgi:hypothetical protein